MSKFKVGDKVIAVRSGCGLHLDRVEEGTVFTITKVGGYRDEFGYQVSPPVGNTKSGLYYGMIGEKSFAPYIEPKKDDPVAHPAHYTSHPSGVECIDITEHYDFCIGNAMKYLWRQGLKQDTSRDPVAKQIEDCEKALWYINRHIDSLKNNEGKMSWEGGIDFEYST